MIGAQVITKVLGTGDQAFYDREAEPGRQQLPADLSQVPQ